MKQNEKNVVITVLLNRYGKTFASEIGVDPLTNTPAALFRLWCASILVSARIRAAIAIKASRALFDRGWVTAQKLGKSTWEEKVRVLNGAGYARYDESTARMLGDSVSMLLDRYGGDLRRLRELAGRSPQEERRLLLEFKGLGNVGVDIFFREVQLVWDELYPLVDQKALKAAEQLELGRDANEIASLLEKTEFVRLLAGLVRVSLSNEFEEVRKAARVKFPSAGGGT